MIIGTAGHVDHGKTALVRALTGVDTDRLKEEKARGISIDLGFAYMPAPDGTVIGFVDVPGHERFIHNMLAGVAGIDFALLVVAADDGIMPQTREHLAILDLLGVARGLVVLSKCDLVSAARCDEVAEEVDTLLAATVLAGAQRVTVSSVTGEGISALRERLFAVAAAVPAPGDGGAFRLAVDRCFSLPGAGTIVTGTVFSGRVARGESVLVSPLGRPARVRAIHAHNRPAKVGRAGERCALNLVGEGIDKASIRRGQMVLDPALHAPVQRIDARLRLLASEAKTMEQWMPVRLHHAASEVGTRVVLLDEGAPVPGGAGWVQLVIERPIAASVGDCFVLRDTTGSRTIGGGRFVDLRAPARRRHTPERLRELAARAEADPERALSLMLEGPPFHADLRSFARDRALRGEEIAALAERLGLVAMADGHSLFALTERRWNEHRRAVEEKLAAFHAENPDLQGMAGERLRLVVSPRLPQPVFACAMKALAARGAVARDGAWVRLPAHEARFSPLQEKIWQRIVPLLSGAARFRPPRVRDIAGALSLPEIEVRRLLKLAARMGKVDEVAIDHFFLRSTIAEIVAIADDAAGVAPGHSFGAGDLRDRLQNGRKVAIQILEFLDRHGVTLRRGDLRRIDARRRDLFGTVAVRKGIVSGGASGLQIREGP